MNFCSFSRVFWTKPSANKKSTVPSSSSGPESQSRDRRSGRKTRVLAVSPRPKRWATAWVPRFTRLMQEHSMRFLRKLFEPAAESLRSVCDAASQLSSRTDYTMICYAMLYYTIPYHTIRGRLKALLPSLAEVVRGPGGALRVQRLRRSLCT